MKKLLTNIVLSILGCGAVITTFADQLKIMPIPTCGFYAGVGGSWNTIDESFDSLLMTSNQRSGQDSYTTNHSRLGPMVQIGYWRPLCQRWLWGGVVQWKYLYYLTPNDNATKGQHLPNASFSSRNIFGGETDRDFNSQNRVNNEFVFLFYMGRELLNGYVYLGIGPVLFTVDNSVYVSSIHTPNGVGDHLRANSVSNHKTIWGGTVQVGYNFYLDPTFFLNFSYSYSQTGNNTFTNSVNTANFNGFFTPGPTTLNLSRSISFKVQEVMFSINKVFEI